MGMKDSGIQWIGEIPEEWELKPNKYVMKKIKDICSKYKGEDILSLTIDGVIVRDLDNPTGKMPETFDGYQKVKKGNLLMCLFDMDVTPRCIGIIENDGLTSPAYSQFVLYPEADEKYFYYYYLNLDFTKELLHLARNLRHSLTESQLGDILVPLPPIQEQQLIADFLDDKVEKIDDILVDLNKQVEILTSYKKSLITETVTKGLNPDAPMKDSEIDWIGEIPESWNVSKLKYVSNFVNGDRGSNYPSGEDMVDEGIIFVTSNNIHGTELDNSPEISKYITKERYKLLGGAKLEINDIIFCLRGSVGMCAINTKETSGTIASSLVDIKPVKINSHFMNYFLQSKISEHQTNLFMNGSCAANLAAENVSNYYFIEPPLSEQQDIADYLYKKCAQVDDLISDKQTQIEKMENYKKSLIYEYVTGKKRVKGAEI